MYLELWLTIMSIDLDLWLNLTVICNDENTYKNHWYCQSEIYINKFGINNFNINMQYSKYLLYGVYNVSIHIIFVFSFLRHISNSRHRLKFIIWLNTNNVIYYWVERYSFSMNNILSVIISDTPFLATISGILHFCIYHFW